MDTILESFLPQNEFGVESTSVAPAILSQPDFNGDGIVNYKDVLIINFKVLQGRVTGRYDAIFDRNWGMSPILTGLGHMAKMLSPYRF